MIMLVTFLTRRPGMSVADFRAYYEANHRIIGEKVLGGYACHYIRRFTDPADGMAREGDPDVVMEIWFPDRATYDACFANIARPEVIAEIVEDEERLFDRSKLRSYIVTEYESDMPEPA